MPTSLLVEYANILQKEGVYSKAAKAFRAARKSNSVFLARAKKLEMCFLNRDALLGKKPSEAPVRR